ncbi:phage tail protein [Citrobacter sp. Cb028]|uniref:phage tail protein n=1 Tax=Citrobacter sp. Cb028 TaxID=2985024 RepID=UPI0025767DE2|nr:phage tail protein [Citrobacter sp. Cb028]MDM3454458.1 phage tail protein [Citrobacter sp. Cb028]
MSAKFYTLLTDIGAAKLASAAALGVPLKITHMAVGSGGGVLPTPNAQQTALVAEERRAALNMLYIDPQNSSQIIAEQVIPENEGGWWIREVGLFDETGALIAVGNCPESYKPKLAEGSGRTQTVRMVLITSSTDNITLRIDPAVVLATRKYVDDKVLELRVYVDDLMAKHLAAADPHTQYATKESPTLTGTPKAPTAPAGTNTTQIASTAFVQAVVTALNNALALKAPLASPTLTGTPTAPTAAQTVNNTQVATTAFVKSAIAALVASSPAALDTLNELAAALGNDPNFATTMTNALAGKQQKDATLTNLSGKDVAGLLQYLGLTYFADRGSLALQDFAGPLSSKDSVTATSPDGTTRKISLNATNGLQIVIYDGGQYRGAINVPTKAGTMALTSDLVNFADKSSAAEQSFTGPVSSGEGLVAKYGAAKIILSAQNGQRIVVYTNDTYRGAINIPLRDGTMALLDDVTNVSATLLGITQSWQNVKASRSAGVTYTNSTGRPIAVSIAGIMASRQNGVQLSLAVNGTEASSFAVTDSSFDIRGNVFAIVPPGATYNLTASNINSIITWSELR